MSRIGKKEINIVAGVKVEVCDNNLVIVQGPKGKLEKKFSSDIKISVLENKILVERLNDSKKSRALHGLTRTLIFNMIEGVTKGFSKTLEIVGVGYRASKSGDKLVLNLGYAHPVVILDSEEVKSFVEQNKIIVKGIDKEKVGQYAANIREKKPPEPYKGKGIKYAGEKIRRKVGKTGKK